MDNQVVMLRSELDESRCQAWERQHVTEPGKLSGPEQNVDELADLRSQLADLEAAVAVAVQDARNGWAAHDRMLHLVYKNDARADHWRRRAWAIVEIAGRMRRECQAVKRELAEARAALAEHREALEFLRDVRDLEACTLWAQEFRGKWLGGLAGHFDASWVVNAGWSLIAKLLAASQPAERRCLNADDCLARGDVRTCGDAGPAGWCPVDASQPAGEVKE